MECAAERERGYEDTRLSGGFKDPKYRACPLLVQKVQAGHLGKKTGRGFYTYA